MTPAGGLRHGRERGSIAPAVPIIALALLLLGGLVIDASRQLNARGEAVAFAEEAARAGAQGVTVDVPVEVDPREARRMVDDFCAQILTRQGVTGCRLVAVEPSTEPPRRPLYVVTEVQMEVPATLLGIVGVRSLTAAGAGRSEPVEGDNVDVAP